MHTFETADPLQLPPTAAAGLDMDGTDGCSDSGCDMAGPDSARPRLPLHAMPGHLIRRIHQQSLALYAARTAAYDLTPVQYAALHAVGGCPDSDQVGIARAIACDKATVGAVLDRLQSKGLIVRSADASDRRVRRLQLTEPGRAMLQEIEPAVAQVQRDLLAPLEPEQAAQLMQLLEILASASPPTRAS